MSHSITTTSADSAPFGLGKKEGVQFFRKPTRLGPPTATSITVNEWTISLIAESLEAQSVVYQQFYSQLNQELKIVPTLTQHVVNNTDVIIIPCDNSWGLLKENTLTHNIAEMVGSNMTNSVKDYIFTMYFGEQPPGSSFLLCFNGVYLCWVCMSRVKQMMPKRDFAFNTIWSALSAINQYNLSLKHAKEKMVLRKVLVPEFAQFCETKGESQQAMLQMGIAIKQWLNREYVEVDGARDAMARNKMIMDPEAMLKTSLEKEMEGLIWSRDIEKRGLCSYQELDCLVDWVNNKKGAVSISCCKSLITLLSMDENPYTLPRQIMMNRILSSTNGCLSKIIDYCVSGDVKVHQEIPIAEIMDMGESIGEGATSTVRKGVWNGKHVAVKTMFGGENNKEFKREVSLLSMVRHRNIITCWGADTQTFVIVMELLQTSLFALLHEHRVDLDLFQRLLFVEGAARGMKFLHSCGIVHRDLKSLNILISNNLEVKLCDFGLSRVMDDSTMTKNIGTVAWIAPEVLSAKGEYTEKADVYSFGIIVWEAYARKQPFADQQAFSIPILVAKGERPLVEKTCPADWKSLMVKCWHKRPQSRPSFSMVVKFLRQMKMGYATSQNVTRKRLVTEDKVLKIEDTGQVLSVYDSSPSTECSDNGGSSYTPMGFRLTSESSLSSSLGFPGQKRKVHKSFGSGSGLTLNTGSANSRGSEREGREEKEKGKVRDDMRVSSMTSRKSEKTSSTLSSTFSISGLDSEK